MKRVLKWEVPADGVEHVIAYGGRIVYVGCQTADTVAFWTEVGPGERLVRRGMTVLPTGAWAVGNCEHVGTALALDGKLVWHLYQEVN